MYQGRANQKLGKYRNAVGLYVELLDQPDSPDAFRRLKTETMNRYRGQWLLCDGRGRAFQGMDGR